MIFYFSATGNSLYIAEKISEITREEIANIASVMKKEHDLSFKNDEKICIVSPVYFYGLPLIVEDFIRKIDPKNKKEVSLVLNYGTFPGQAMARAERILRESDLCIHSKMTVRMPENYTLLFNPPESEECEKIIKDATKKIIEFAESVKKDVRTDLCDRPRSYHKIVGLFARPIYDHGRGTARFHVNTDCIKCGKCVRMCPSEAIKIVDRIPTWVEKRCLRCCACINRCPHKAIEFGLLTKNKRRYVNPYVDFAEQTKE